MDNLISWVGVFVAIVGGILLPILFNQLAKIDEKAKRYFNTLDDILDKLSQRQRDIESLNFLIKDIHESLKHRSQIAQLKYDILKDKIADLEGYLQKANDYVPRHSSRSVNTSTPTTYDED